MIYKISSKNTVLKVCLLSPSLPGGRMILVCSWSKQGNGNDTQASYSKKMILKKIEEIFRLVELFPKEYELNHITLNYKSSP